MKRFIIPGYSDRQMCDGGDKDHPNVDAGWMEGGSLGLQCFACSVVVANPFFKYLPKASNLELYQIRRNESYVSSNSRLACQLTLEP